jgi:hypothetical protein
MSVNADAWETPTHCSNCEAPVIRYAIQHKPGCPVLLMIEDARKVRKERMPQSLKNALGFFNNVLGWAIAIAFLCAFNGVTDLPGVVVRALHFPAYAVQLVDWIDAAGWVLVIIFSIVSAIIGLAYLVVLIVALSYNWYCNWRERRAQPS